MEEVTGQEPTEFDLGCFFHGFEGDITQDKVPYLACGECGHLYWTERQLIDEFNSVGREGAMKFGNGQWRNAVSGDEIHFCIWCAHDF